MSSWLSWLECWSHTSIYDTPVHRSGNPKVGSSTLPEDILFCFFTHLDLYALSFGDIFRREAGKYDDFGKSRKFDDSQYLRTRLSFILLFVSVFLDSLYMINALLGQFACFSAQYDFLSAAAYKKALHLYNCHYEQYVSAVASHCNESKSITVCLCSLFAKVVVCSYLLPCLFFS